MLTMDPETKMLKLDTAELDAAAAEEVTKVTAEIASLYDHLCSITGGREVADATLNEIKARDRIKGRPANPDPERDRAIRTLAADMQATPYAVAGKLSHCLRRDPGAGETATYGGGSGDPRRAVLSKGERDKNRPALEQVVRRALGPKAPTRKPGRQADAHIEAWHDAQLEIWLAELNAADEPLREAATLRAEMQVAETARLNAPVVQAVERNLKAWRLQAAGWLREALDRTA